MGGPELPAAAGAFAATETAGDAPDGGRSGPGFGTQVAPALYPPRETVDAEEGRSAETTPEPAAD